MSELFGAVNRVHSALSYHLERQNVIASNIANVDTPGFTPQEVLRPADSDFGARLSAAKTHSAHMGTGPAAGSDYVVETDRAVQPGTDGNSVSLEREMSKLGANSLRYEGASRIVSRQLAMLRYAANDGHA